MIEYLLLLMPVFLAALLFRRHARIYFATSLYITLIAGLRLNIGYDYPSYVAIYYLEIEPNLEYLSDLIMQAARALGQSQYYFLLTSILTIGCITAGLWRYSRDPLLSFWAFLCMPYMFLISLGVIRQYTAIAFSFLLLSYFKRLGLLRLFPLLACTVFLHTSAFILLPFSLLWRLLARSLPAWFMLGSLPALYSLSNFVRNISTTELPFAQAYFGEGDHGLKLYIFYVLILILLLAFRHRAALDSNALRYLNLFYIGIALFSLTVALSEAAARISYFFLIFLTPLLPYYNNLFRPRQLARGVIIFFLFLLLFVQLFIASQNPEKDPYIPYQINTKLFSDIF